MITKVIVRGTDCEGEYEHEFEAKHVAVKEELGWTTVCNEVGYPVDYIRNGKYRFKVIGTTNCTVDEPMDSTICSEHVLKVPDLSPDKLEQFKERWNALCEEYKAQ